MIIDLSGKRAIVTGSTAWHRLCHSQRLAGLRGEVIVNGRTKSRVDVAVAELKKSVKVKVTGIAADLSTAEGADAFIKAAGEADILVNNIGISGRCLLVEITDADWMRILRRNVMSGIRVSRHYLPAHGGERTGAASSSSPASPLCSIPTEMIHYGMTKTAQLAIARGMARVGGRQRCHRQFGAAGPDALGRRRRFLRQAGKGSRRLAGADGEGIHRQHRSSSVVQRLLVPEEVANMIV